MTTPAPHDVTRLLAELSAGDPAALPKLMPLVYEELRALANRALRRERSDHTLATTALVNEAYLRLVDQRNPHWRHRTHFFAVAAQLMRRILVDHARGRRAAKRGGGQARVALDDAVDLAEGRAVDLIALDEALTRLAELDPQQGRLVELRFFGGLTLEETAAALEISLATVKREWTSAKAWLRREIRK